jgi:hypothetical protein
MSLTKLVELASITSSSSVFTSGILSHNFNKEVIRIKTVTKKENKKGKKSYWEIDLDYERYLHIVEAQQNLIYTPSIINTGCTLGRRKNACLQQTMKALTP